MHPEYVHLMATLNREERLREAAAWRLASQALHARRATSLNTARNAVGHRLVERGLHLVGIPRPAR